ncbi:DUF1904 domain-containing protein [Alkaliphilus pronyensis]|uniref:DUF1904 domain-containing protein n=1 Tax=Alkaliphilus pronyensis TaxID=1482732 RepID=A0A6I0F5T3_9FIRM|nr:DUF1904 domain-containing protein [Alkaliphilus pronyensis]KAB3531621.1 DUF1904 domain-containing protein [Alkaliphilus pronyensis]
MPQIKVRGIQLDKLASGSEKLVNELVKIVECPKDYFELEYIQSVAIRDGEIQDAYPFIEVAWFDRGLEIQDKVAAALTRFAHNIGVENIDIAFVTFEERKYYENGKHFG